MSERFDKIFSLTDNLYTQGSPIVIRASALLKDKESSWLIAQLKLCNISNRTVKFVRVELNLLDSMGREIGAPITFDYLDLCATRGTDFGTQTPIKIDTPTARSYTVKVIEVGFTDNTVWNNDGKVWGRFSAPRSIESVLNNDIAVRGYKAIFGTNANKELCEHFDLWICTCGEINHSDEERCYRCNASREELKSTSVDELINEGIYTEACKMAADDSLDDLRKAVVEFEKIKGYKDSLTLIQNCEAKIDSLKSEKKRSRKEKKIASIICAILLLAPLFLYFVCFPLIAYAVGEYKSYVNVYNVKKFKIPDSVTSIGDYAFSRCSSLTSVVIGDSVTSIGEGAFFNCRSLTSVVIGDSVTSIGDCAFSSCSSLTSVEIPDSVTSIGSYAFEDCRSLTSVVIGDSVTSIGYNAFEGCGGLQFNEYDNALYLGNKNNPYLALIEAKDKQITSCNIHTDTKIIADDAFEYCRLLTSIEIPDSVTSIGEYSFSRCSSLTSVEIPDSVTSIGSHAFAYCTSLTSIEVDVNNTVYKSIDGNLYTKDGKILVQYAIGKSNTSFAIPDSVTSIGSSAFEGCGGLQFNEYDNALYLGNKNNPYLALIEAKDKQITSCNIHTDTKIIAGDAFENCRSLTSVVIGDSVTSIGWEAFSGCRSLKDVHYTGSEADWAEISIGEANDDLTDATIHYNYVPQ